MNERMENVPILQDFVPYRGRCPKSKPSRRGRRMDGQTDGQTDRWMDGRMDEITDRPTNGVTYRVAYTRLKKAKFDSNADDNGEQI